MNRNFFLTSFYPIINLFAVAFVLLAKKASCIDPNFLACNPKTCGDGQKISYPFYIQNEQEPFCGYPGFNVSCNKGKPVFKLSNNEYIVHEIFYQNQSLRVSNAIVFGKCIPCIPPIQNMSLADGGFQLSSNETSLFLLYNCNSSLLVNDTDLLKYKVDCVGGDETVSTLAMLDHDPLLGSASEKCETGVVAPVELYRGENVGIERMLERGFVLNWTASNCSTCEKSGGKCGFDSSTYHFKCFCPDRPHAQYCNSDAGKRNRMWIILASVGFVLIMSLAGLFWYLRRRRLREKYLKELLTWDATNDIHELENDGNKGHNLKVYSAATIMAATNSFSAENKLGQGGFGPVYKGKLSDGREIAVKRLSRSSGQGLVELKNELILIAKLQHVNLVRLLGCCIQGEEKMLVYVYMPNKSLDSFIFDQSNREMLDWKKRFEIIEGVAQGLLYLHKYSRLRIIHRDLKASNILLDENLNPKISDFGMARIVKINELEANTNRVVGTYGYMSPEYAMEGVFSVKSDVFSFGVLMLEIVCGRKNRDLFHIDPPLNLVGYAWELWKEGNQLELVDPTLRDSCSKDQVLRCIHVGLLCIEDDAMDRPTMSDVIWMLTSEAPLPLPKQPAFSNARTIVGTELNLRKPRNNSINNVSMSTMEAR